MLLCNAGMEDVAITLCPGEMLLYQQLNTALNSLCYATFEFALCDGLRQDMSGTRKVMRCVAFRECLVDKLEVLYLRLIHTGKNICEYFLFVRTFYCKPQRARASHALPVPPQQRVARS